MNKLDRRKFLKGGAIASTAVAGSLAAPAIARAEPVVLKVQAGWVGGIFLENAQSYVERVHAMAEKDLKIDLLAVNSFVRTGQMQNAVHRGTLDGAHYDSVANFCLRREKQFFAKQDVDLMSALKGRHFSSVVVLWAVRWYCLYGISDRDLETMMLERGVSFDHSTLYRWVEKYAP